MMAQMEGDEPQRELTKDDLKRIVERDKPGWELDDSPMEPLSEIQPEAVSPSLEALQQKFFPEEFGNEVSGRIREAQKIVDRHCPGYLVVDALKADNDGVQALTVVLKSIPESKVLQKTILVKDGKPFAAQG